jgi:hypothetical protein
VRTEGLPGRPACENSPDGLNLPRRWHDRLGNRHEARRWPEKSHGLRGDGARGVDAVGALALSALRWDRLQFRFLLDEADAPLLDADFPADPFAPSSRENHKPESGPTVHPGLGQARLTRKRVTG